ncbi:MAG: hypothetical protein JO069_13905 [Verrucomicrobia bacterium]|nr:hypothetical protein [Verrucomicrobiota bacterium]
MNPDPTPSHFSDLGRERPPAATICILGGSNLGMALARSGYVQGAFTWQTKHGPSPVIYHGKSGPVPFYHIPHHGASPDDAGTVALPDSLLRTWSALFELGVIDVLGGATAGGINPGYQLGNWVIPNDFIDFNLDRKRSIAPAVLGPDAKWILPRYLPADDPELRALLAEITRRVAGEARTHTGGVIAQAAGGRFETAAEVRMFRTLGADLVTLNVPTEMAYARQLNINFSSVLAISNPAEGLGAWDWKTLTSLYPKFHAESVAIYMAAVEKIGPVPHRRIGDSLRVHPDFD